MSDTPEINKSVVHDFETLANVFNEQYHNANDAARLHEKDGWRYEADWQKGYAAAYYQAAWELRKLIKKWQEGDTDAR